MALGRAADRTYSVALNEPGGSEIRLHVEEWGDGPPLVLLHGLGASTFTWRHIAPKLATSRRVIALDLRGFGLSDKPLDLNYAAVDQAALVAGFVKKRGLHGVTLVGHSFGGTVALMTALSLRDDPGRIGRLVLIAAPAVGKPLTPAEAAALTPLLPYALLGVTPPEALARLILGYARSPDNPPPDADVKGYAAPFRDLGARHAFITTTQGIIANDLSAAVAEYRTLRQPALLIWCRSDTVVPLATGKKLARLLPNARLRTLRRCNHLPQDERPEALLSMLSAEL